MTPQEAVGSVEGTAPTGFMSLPSGLTPPKAVGSAGGTTPIGFVSPPSAVGDELDINHDDAPLQFRALNKVVGPTEMLGLA